MSKESLSSIEPRENIWSDKELLKNADIYNFDSLMQNLGEFRTSIVGMGYYGIVFRLQQPQNNLDITLKLMRFNTSINAQDLCHLLKKSHLPQNNALIKLFLLTDFRNRADYLTKNLAFAQSAGHILGNIVAPNYVDAPIALWARNGDLVGYSLPYLKGIPKRIYGDKELSVKANELEKNYNLFLGSRGTTIIRGSKNAILLNNGNKRFIDVRLKNTEDFSIPNL
jgi:hypothetical protein